MKIENKIFYVYKDKRVLSFVNDTRQMSTIKEGVSVDKRQKMFVNFQYKVNMLEER